MALFLDELSFFLAFTVLLSLLNCCASFNPSLFNGSTPSSGWSPAMATWYGSPTGGGSNGGACGYGDAVESAPFSSMVAAGGPSLFKSGKGCGTCYQVRCTGNVTCSGEAVTVVITDECPGGPCLSNPVHFDLSGTAFGSMATPGKADQLRSAGLIPIQYKRTACDYGDTSVAFHVDLGSNLYYFAVVVEYLEGDGDLSAVHLKQAGDNNWLPMRQSWGAVWMLNSGAMLQAPFSLRLTSLSSEETLEAENVIPDGWQPGVTYWSGLNVEP